MSRFTGIWRKFDAYTPPAVRLLALSKARTPHDSHVRLLEDSEIAEASGLPVSRIQQIYWSKTWDDIPLGECRAFFKGCGYDLDDSNDSDYLARRLIRSNDFRWRHLQKSKNHAQWTQLLKFAAE